MCALFGKMLDVQLAITLTDLYTDMPCEVDHTAQYKRSNAMAQDVRIAHLHPR